MVVSKLWSLHLGESRAPADVPVSSLAVDPQISPSSEVLGSGRPSGESALKTPVEYQNVQLSDSWRKCSFC